MNDTYVICINPTNTLSYLKEYYIYNFKEDLILIRNNNRFVWVNRDRFISKINNNMEVICTDKNRFVGITKGNKYTVVDEQNEFYFIINDKKIVKKYSKNFFIKYIEEKPVIEEISAVCLFPFKNELTFGRRYSFKLIGNDAIEIVNDLNETRIYKKNRFRI